MNLLVFNFIIHLWEGDIIKEITLKIFSTKDKKYWNSTPQVLKSY